MPYFSEDEKVHFKEQGYVVKHDVVSMDLISPAEDVLWEEIEAERNDPATWVGSGPRGNLKCSRHPSVRATLLESPIQDMCEELVGPYTLNISNYTFAKMIYPTGKGQDSWQHPEHGHLDAYNGGGAVDSFTVAVTMNVNHIKPKAGGFTVWPGTHRRAYRYFQLHCILNGLEAFQDEDGAYVDLPEPIEVSGSPGTVTFWHHLLMHQAGNNHGKQIRMAFVSRFSRKDLNDIRFEFPGDMWTYWNL